MYWYAMTFRLQTVKVRTLESFLKKNVRVLIKKKTAKHANYKAKSNGKFFFQKFNLIYKKEQYKRFNTFLLIRGF